MYMEWCMYMYMYMYVYTVRTNTVHIQRDILYTNIRTSHNQHVKYPVCNVHNIHVCIFTCTAYKCVVHSEYLYSNQNTS